MGENIQSIRGMNDILPDEIAYWQHIEAVFRNTAERYGYRELRMPIVEPTALFKRTLGDTTDIVEKEMYTFTDRNGDSLTLRPEGTASCVRAGIQNGLFYNQTQRLWYMGPMFRHERPQKGRYRQFYQFGIEAAGFAHPSVDVEVIAFSAAIWQQLGLSDKIHLQINSLGTPASRLAYRDQLVAYFSEHQDALDEDSKRRLVQNPMRILDSKNPELATLIANAPRLDSTWDDATREHFATVRELLDQLQISYQVNPCLVRGLDYYTHTVFEWVSGDLGAQSAVCAGGRYDGLIEQLGGGSVPAVGFALGLERLVELLAANTKQENIVQLPDVFVVTVGEEAVKQGVLLAEQLRKKIPQLRIIQNGSNASFKAQFKRADKSGAKVALVLGEEELSRGIVTVKSLREQQEQSQLEIPELVTYLQQLIGR